MTVSFYLTHPEVRIEPETPVPFWGLSAIGAARAKAFAARDLLPRNAVFVSSEEIKAEELAEILASRHGNPIVTRPELGENDRSATGYLAAEAFERQVELFFAHPEKSANGWETAEAAQARITKAVSTAHAEFGAETPLVFVGHGGVGTLLKCAIGNRGIARSEDQGETGNPGGGNLFAFELAAKRLLCDWTSFENWQGI
jgi:broad specificity phosphatase PhoE